MTPSILPFDILQEKKKKGENLKRGRNRDREANRAFAARRSTYFEKKGEGGGERGKGRREKVEGIFTPSPKLTKIQRGKKEKKSREGKRGKEEESSLPATRISIKRPQKEKRE